MSTSLLLHCDGVNNSTTFTDSSGLNHTVTAHGNAKISTDQSKFGGSSAYFSGNGDCLSIPYSSDFNFGNGDFTIELNVYKTANNSNYSRLWRTDGVWYSGLYFTVGSDGYLWVIGSLSGSNWDIDNRTVALLGNNQWYHIAVVRHGGNLTAFVDGTGTTLSSTLGTTPLYTDTSAGFLIGGDEYAFFGYIDELRITKGVALYTSNFTPDPYPFSNPGDLSSANNSASTTADASILTLVHGVITASNSASTTADTAGFAVLRQLGSARSASGIAPDGAGLPVLRILVSVHHSATVSPDTAVLLTMATATALASLLRAASATADRARMIAVLPAPTDGILGLAALGSGPSVSVSVLPRH
jgi:hypothetical protein